MVYWSSCVDRTLWSYRKATTLGSHGSNMKLLSLNLPWATVSTATFKATAVLVTTNSAMTGDNNLKPLTQMCRLLTTCLSFSSECSMTNSDVFGIEDRASRTVGCGLSCSCCKNFRLGAADWLNIASCSCGLSMSFLVLLKACWDRSVLPIPSLAELVPLSPAVLTNSACTRTMAFSA